MIFDGKRLSEALAGIGRSLSGSVLNQALAPVQGAIGSAVGKGMQSILGGILPFAKGAAFGAGRVAAFARGGVVDGPTHFPMRGGVGLMGEAGPEAIMPLSARRRRQARHPGRRERRRGAGDDEHLDAGRGRLPAVAEPDRGRDEPRDPERPPQSLNEGRHELSRRQVSGRAVGRLERRSGAPDGDRRAEQRLRGAQQPLGAFAAALRRRARACGRSTTLPS